MTLGELTHAEQLALVGLVRLMIRLDGQFTEGERQVLDNLVDELGEQQFGQLSAEADDKIQDEAAVKHYASHVVRQDARELIFGAIYDLAIPDSIVQSEASLLSWLSDTWQIEAGAQR